MLNSHIMKIDRRGFLAASSSALLLAKQQLASTVNAQTSKPSPRHASYEPCFFGLEVFGLQFLMIRTSLGLRVGEAVSSGAPDGTG